MRSAWCLCVYHRYEILNARFNLYETCYVYHDTEVHLNDVFHKSLPSAFMSAYVSLLLLLGNGSV
jgi:hypothetical protein